MKNDKSKQKILESVSSFVKDQQVKTSKFIPVKSHVPASGKLIGHEEIKMAVDACLDGWFTSGRFVLEFEKRFSKFMDQRHCLLTNSGSSANC